MLESMVVVLSLMVFLMFAGYVGLGIVVFRVMSRRSRTGQQFSAPLGGEKAFLDRVRKQVRPDPDPSEHDGMPPDIAQVISAYPSDARDDVLDWIRENKGRMGWDGIRAGVKGTRDFDDQIEEL